MSVVLIKTDNFNSHEIIHRNPEDLPDQLAPIAYALTYRMQSFREFVNHKENENIRINVTSGYRNPLYNKEIGGAEKSFHIWRFTDEGQMVWALDINSLDLQTSKLYEYAVQFFKGEVYLNTNQNIVHVSDYGPKENWIS
jgi:uncharacterized protein YcbK (DUF882 family)